MWNWTGHMGGWWWLMAPLMIAFWALVIWAVVGLVRRDRIAATSSQGSRKPACRTSRPRDIDEVEYRQQRALIRT